MADRQSVTHGNNGVFGGEPVNQPGQYPGSLFGVALPQGTGAPGTQGAGGMADPTNEPGQLNEGISGQGPGTTADTGAPGSQGAVSTQGGPDSVSYTPGANYFKSESQPADLTVTASDSISGTDDWTQANDGSYGGGRYVPGVQGNTPT
ncbi:MAG TPA: hypothetical protein VKE40_22925, partial [Gemmataceae bacterium]|nr:hypothetical protein [Gemmataceae bacterium]